jgi:hypothetical protein
VSTFQGQAAQIIATALVQKHSETVAEMSAALGFINPAQISIGTDGSVSIRSKSVADRIERISRQDGGGELFDSNCGCAVNQNC